MTKEFKRGFQEAIYFVSGKTGASQPAREIVAMMRAYLKKLAKEKNG